MIKYTYASASADDEKSFDFAPASDPKNAVAAAGGHE